MKLGERIQSDLVQAMKRGDRVSVSTLRLLRAAAQNVEVDRRRPLTDEEYLEVVSRQAKLRREAIDGFERGNRPEAVARERAELLILQSYLPQPFEESEVRAVLARAITEAREAGRADLGSVMSRSMPQLRGRADGSLVNRLAREMLAERPL